MNSGSLDTNVLARFLLGDSPAEHRAARRLLRQSPAPFAVADTVFIELAFVLEGHYKFSRQDIALAVQGLLAMQILSCNHALIERALPLFTTHPKLSFEDCCLSVYAELNQAEPLWTFDKKLANQASNAQLVS